MDSSVLRSDKVNQEIKGHSKKVSETSQKKEGEKRDVTFDDIGQPAIVRPLKTFLHEPVRGGRFLGYENPITGNGSGPQLSPHAEDTI